MMSEVETEKARAEVRSWVLRKVPQLTDDALTETTPLLEARLITSLHVPDLLLLLEGLRREPIDLSALKPGDLKDLKTIYSRFLERR